MCGIVGILDGTPKPVAEERLRRMAGRLTHRGPDAEGYWTSPAGVGFGHRRLSIIDPLGSPQPMQRGPLHVSFNGEIFNYAALREQLVGRGYAFSTQGDTEVLLALFHDRGPDLVHDLEGQFAFAIWDERDESLWLFRDRMGVVPLYYHWEGQRLVFASEIKAVLEGVDASPEIDDESVADYLAYRSVPSPNTLWKGVRKLPPGTRLRVSRAHGPSLESYWALPTEDAGAVEPQAAVSSVEAALRQAVAARLVADVPVGAFLSGGVDSSMIVALMTEIRGASGVETFSAGFDDPRFDELPYAREVGSLLSTRHHETIIRPSDFENLWGDLSWHRDAPISEPADLAIFCLAKLARESSIKVLLSGEGSDELFAGYPKYRWAPRLTAVDRIPPGIRSKMFRMIEHHLPGAAGRARILIRALATRAEEERYQAWFAPFTRYERDQLAPVGAAVERRGAEEIVARGAGDLVQRMLYFDCHTWLTDNLLERGDRMAMAASVESRPPFMDHRVVELAFSLPTSVKVRDGRTKWVVKEVARKLLPAEIVDRPKVGFRVPLDVWFRSGLRDMANDLLLDRNSFVGTRFRRDQVEALLSSHAGGRRNEEIRIWTLLSLEVWYRSVFLAEGRTAFPGPQAPGSDQAVPRGA